MQNENENSPYPSFPNYENTDDTSNPFLYEEVIYKKKKPKYWLHILLFVITFLATTLAGAEWIFGEKSFIALLFDVDGFAGIGSGGLGFDGFVAGLAYSIPFLGILTVHEFGHYFAAKYHNIRASLPFYIPMWLGFLGMPSTIGTMGAFIKIESPFTSQKSLFDVGVAGPLAGFVIALIVLFYGFLNLPSPEYVIEVAHPSWQKYGLDYASYVYKSIPEGANMELGTNLLFEFFKNYVAPNPEWVPNNREIFHYPFLLAGYLALFFTALNLMPIGQLDGGHVLYAMFGEKWHKKISMGMFTLFLTYAGLGLISPQDPIEDIALYSIFYLFFLFIIFLKNTEKPINAVVFALGIYAFQFIFVSIFPEIHGYYGWLAFGFLLGRVLGLSHPPTQNQVTPLTKGRMIVGVITFIIFILCFSPQPFVIS